jgi:hypothetical protein
MLFNVIIILTIRQIKCVVFSIRYDYQDSTSILRSRCHFYAFGKKCVFAFGAVEKAIENGLVRESLYETKLLSMFTCVFHTPKASWGRHPEVCDFFNSLFRGNADRGGKGVKTQKGITKDGTEKGKEWRQK